MMENSDYSLYFDSSDLESAKKLILTNRKKVFIQSCYEAYEALCLTEEEHLDLSDLPDSNFALRRMLGLFLDLEEYEKCTLLQRILDEHFPGNTSPLFEYRDIYKNT